jgi:hypothetical protein
MPTPALDPEQRRALAVHLLSADAPEEPSAVAE